MNKILFGISVLGLIFSSIFVVVSIWNTEWMLLEKGYYTFGTLTVAVSTYLAVQFLMGYSHADTLGKLNASIGVIFSIIALLFMMISVRNTEWILLEKGYYWMGMVFVTLTSAMLSATIKSIMSNEESLN